MDSTEKQNDILVNQVAATSTRLKLCPFCASRAEIFQADDRRFGIGCPGCPVAIPAIYQSAEVAVMWWNLRQGTASYRGGLATKGLSTRRKRRACRRNLRKARQQKQLRRIRGHTESTMVMLKAARAVEMAEVQAAAKISRAKLAALEPQIRADPSLSRILALLRHGQAEGEPAAAHR